MSKTFNAIIVDDEPIARDIIRTHLEKLPKLIVKAECKNAIDALAVLKAEHIDVVFLDINMPEVSGLSFGKLINKDVKLIFTTAHREYAVEGFELQAVDYLLKPISFERLKKATDKLTGFIQETEQKIRVKTDTPSDFTFVRADRKMVKVNFDDISYVESLSDYIKIHTNTDTVVTRETISNFEAKLPKLQFIRTHRSFIVSISSIVSFTNEYVEVPNKAIPISRSYKEEVVLRLQN